MRFLGLLFILVVFLAAVGYLRGWFFVTTTHASGKDEVTLAVDDDKIRDDGKAASAKLGQLSAQGLEKVKSLGRTVSPSESAIDGTLTAVDAPAHEVTLTASAQTIELHVLPTVPIAKDGKDVGFEQLRPGTNVKAYFQHVGDDRRLSRIEVLH
jgi:hypothetical protein